MITVTRTRQMCQFAIFLVLIASHFGRTKAQGCAFTVVPTSSTFKLSGKVTSPVENQLNADPNQAINMLGTLTFNLPCPDTLALLQQEFVAPNSLSGSLTMIPNTVKLSSSLATVTWTDVGFATVVAFTTQGGPAAVNMTVDAGYVLSTSLISTKPDRVEIKGMSGVGQTTPSLSQSGNLVTVTLPAISISMQSIYTATYAGAPLRGVTDYTLTGTIVAQTTIATASVTPTPAPAILATPPTSVLPLAPSPSSVVAPAPATPCTQPTACQDREVFNAVTNTCECPAGLVGPGCNACAVDASGDAACSTLYGGQTATCSDAIPYSVNTAYKAYVCSLEGTGLNDVLEPDTFRVACNTSSSSTGSASNINAVNPSDLGADGAYCQVNFALKNKKNNPLTCKASMCTFTPGSPVVTCLTTNCQCATACPDVQGVLDVIDGNPCTLSCDATGTCTFDIKDFFVKLIAPCTNHECLVENYVMSTEKYTTPTDNDYNPVIAAIPLMGVVAVAAILTGYLFAHRTLFTGSHLPADSFAADNNKNSSAIIDGQQKNASASFMARGKTVEGVPVVSSGTAALRPSPPVGQLTFESLACAVPVHTPWSLFGGKKQQYVPEANVDKRGMKTVLQSVSGVASAGELVGILGPSGSGKTTLLALLSGSKEDRGKNSIVSGTVLLDSEAIPAGRIAYCAQDASLLPTLTVEENIRYSALLRMPPSTTAEQVQAAVGAVIQELGLKKVTHSRVGSTMGGKRGVSGGERRRVSIGMELVTNPSVILLDEPSSGLDSHTAFKLMRTLKQVASGGRIVALSFHQPSPAMFNLLDRVFLMTQGHCVFSGPPAAAEPWLASIGLPCPAGTAVAEQLLYSANDPELLPILISQKKQPVAASNLNKPGGFVNHSREVSKDAAAGEDGGIPLSNDDINTATTLKSGLPSTNGRSASSSSAQVKFDGDGQHSLSGAPFGRELAVLYWRTWTDMKRNPSLVLLHWGTAAIMGLFVGCIFWQVGLDISGAQNRAGGLFFALAFFAFTSLTTVDLLVAERHLVRREVRGAYYSPFSYLVSKIVLDGLLLRAIPVFLYSASFYPMMGLQSGATQVALFLMTLCTFALTVGALSIAVTIGVGTAGKAGLVMNILLLVSLLVGGFFVNVSSIPDWISWLHYLSVFFYGYSILVTNEVSSLLLNFVVEGYAAVKNVRGLTFLKIIGVDAGKMTNWIIILDCFYLAAVLLAFALLYLKMPSTRRARGA